MPEWTHKPEAVIHAEVFINPDFQDAWPIPDGVPVNTDRDFCLELHQFCVDNPLPRWQFHLEQPPYPSLNQFFMYYDRGNVFVVTFDQDRMVWAFRINSNRNQMGLWMHIRREVDFVHEPLGNNPYGGLTQHNKESLREMEALSWAIAGGIQPLHIAGDGENPHVAALDNEALYNNSIETYNSRYAEG